MLLLKNPLNDINVIALALQTANRPVRIPGSNAVMTVADVNNGLFAEAFDGWSSESLKPLIEAMASFTTDDVVSLLTQISQNKPRLLSKNIVQFDASTLSYSQLVEAVHTVNKSFPTNEELVNDTEKVLDIVQDGSTKSYSDITSKDKLDAAHKLSTISKETSPYKDALWAFNKVESICQTLLNHPSTASATMRGYIIVKDTGFTVPDSYGSYLGSLPMSHVYIGKSFSCELGDETASILPLDADPARTNLLDRRVGSMFVDADVETSISDSVYQQLLVRLKALDGLKKPEEENLFSSHWWIFLIIALALIAVLAVILLSKDKKKQEKQENL